MVTCPACGNAVAEGMAFCTSCGAAMARPPAAADPDRTAPAGSAPDTLSWTRKIPLITNPWLVLQCFVIFGGVSLLLGILLSLLTGSWEILIMFHLIGAGLVFLTLLIMLVLQLVTGGGLDTRFFISREGVAYQAGSTTRAMDRISTAGSLVLGSVPGTGAGLLAQSQESNTLGWEDVRYISVYPSVRSLVFRSKYLIGPVVLYCREDNFSTVLAMVKRYAPTGATRNLKP